MEAGLLTYEINQNTLGYGLPILLLSLISTALVVYGWYKKNTPLGYSYSSMLLALTLWLIFYSLRVLLHNSEPAILSNIMAVGEYILMIALPVTWIFFAIIFAGKKKWLSNGQGLYYLILPIGFVFVAFLQKSGGLLGESSMSIGPGIVQELGNNSFASLAWYFSYLLYSLVYFVFGTVLVIKSINRNKRFEQKQVSVLFIGVLIPWIGNITLILSKTPYWNFVAPLIFVLSGALLGWGIYYNHFINIINLAHKLLIDRMGDGLVILDKQNWILEANQEALTLFQARKSSLVGHPVNVLYVSFPEIENIAKQLNIKNHELSVKVGEKTRFFNTDVLPLYSKHRVFAGKIIVFKETTTLKEAFQNLEKAKSRANDADSLKSAFLANLSHEIKTPMNAIIGFSNLLNDVSIDDDERQEFIEHIRNSGSTLLQLIDDIMDISKLDAGQFTLNLGAVDLSKMMAELFARFNDHILSEGKSGIDLILGTELLDSDLNILTDGYRIRQIITNLLSNAVKFTKQGHIEFGYYLDKGTTVQFYVKDTGIGIPYDKHQMIFERFGRVYNANKQEYSGTGLGLALSRGMVRLMGGHIWFESIYGKGSTFYFSIPYNKIEEPETAGSYVKQETKIPTAKESLRIVADEPVIEVDKMQVVMPIIKEVPVSEIPESNIDLDAESDPYLDYLFALTEEKELKQDDSTDPKTKEQAQASKKESRISTVLADLDVESDPILDKLFQDDSNNGANTGAANQTESVSDDISDMPEESDLIFEPEHKPTVSIKDETDFSGSKLLVVDYDDMSYLFIEMILRPTNIQLIRARTFQQAMNLLKGGTDLKGVLLTSEVPDVELVPGINTMKSKYPRCKIIAVTPFANEQKRKECLSNGCLNVIPKPVKQRELLAAVRNLHTIGNM